MSCQTAVTPKLHQRLAVIPRAFVCCFWICCLSMHLFQATAFAGCGIASVHDSYTSYHHGRLEDSADNKDRGGIAGASKVKWIYEGGELIRLPYPMPEKCDGPHCQNSPGNQLAASTATSQKTNVNPSPTISDGFSQALLQAEFACNVYAFFPIDGFPATLLRPPR